MLREPPVEAGNADHLDGAAGLVGERAVPHGERLTWGEKRKARERRENRARESCTGSHHLVHARVDLVPDRIRRPAREEAVVHLVHGGVPEYAHRTVTALRETVRLHVQRFPRVVELPPVGLGGRVGLHLAGDVDVLAAGRSQYQHPFVLADGRICERKRKI